MKPVEMMAEYARLGDVHRALGLLLVYGVITAEDQVRLTRKFMDDRPAFKAAVAKAMGASVVPNVQHTGGGK